MTVTVRQRRPEDADAVVAISRAIYPDSPPWSAVQLASHLAIFPEGQLVAVADERIVGMAASLIVLWDDYSLDTNWRDFTDAGMFTNHDPEHGRTLYGAEVMVDPAWQRRGVGRRLYEARRALVERLGLLRIRAGARLSGYHRYAAQLTPEAYTVRVVRGELSDPTLTFQLKQGFVVLGVAREYLHHDPESLGHAAVIEWLNPAVATPADYADRDPRFSI
ncbi:MAG TPA: GNAT family N-acetyltransferase [Vicinamibacterales bacterium]|nr:GNAT family N-acetyltransferase [Vicinamibacterales bacterium]